MKLGNSYDQSGSSRETREGSVKENFLRVSRVAPSAGHAVLSLVVCHALTGNH